jgi:hypothetical protein
MMLFSVLKGVRVVRRGWVKREGREAAMKSESQISQENGHWSEGKKVRR